MGTEKIVRYSTRDGKGNDIVTDVKIKQYPMQNVTFTCPVCKKETTQGNRIKDIVSGNFTDWAFVGDYVCQNCADLFSLYFYSYVVDPDGIHILNVRELRDTLTVPGGYFQTVLTTSGHIPVITGNSIRGQLRDNCAMHLIRILEESGQTEIKLDKDTFNILFSGGNINGTMRDDIAKAKEVRRHFPMISLLGGGLGDMIMAGKLLCGFAYPVCLEAESITGIQSDVSWHSLMGEIEFTRADNGKDDRLSKYLSDASEEKTAKASTQMRYSVEYMAAGTEFVQDFIFLPGVTDLEMGAFHAGIREWFKVPRLGGMAAKGFGFFVPEYDDSKADTLINQYEDFIRSEGAEYISLLRVIHVKREEDLSINSHRSTRGKLRHGGF